MSELMSSEEVVNTITEEIQLKAQESTELFTKIQYDYRSNVSVKEISIETGLRLVEANVKALEMIEKENKKINGIATSFQEIDDKNKRGIENG